MTLIGSFVALTAAAGVIARLPTAAALPVTAIGGLINARAWYGLAGLAARRRPRARESVPARLVFSLPFAPIAALAVLALVIGVARLLFTGTITVPISPVAQSAPAAHVIGSSGQATRPTAGTAAVLVVGGWGSSCCDATTGLRAALPGVFVRQFSYLGLDARGGPRPSGSDADDLPLPVLGDRLAQQLLALHHLTHDPVDVVAESEGTLAVYAMLDRHPGMPSSVIVVPALHGGLLGDPAVLPLVIKFLSGHQLTLAAQQDGRLRAAAEAIAGAATAWRMPQTASSCPR